MLKLISENYTIYYQSHIDPTQLCSSKSSTIFDLPGKFYAVGFWSKLSGETYQRTLIESIISRGGNILLLCDVEPKNVVIHPNICYITCEWQWFTHTALQDWNVVQLSFGCGKATMNLAEKFSKLGYFSCKLLNPIKMAIPDMEAIITTVRSGPLGILEKTLLFDTTTGCTDRGLGDLIMATVPLKQMHKNGWKIDFIIRPGGYEVLKGASYINKFWVTQHDIAMRRSGVGNQSNLPDPGSYAWHLMLARNLEDYKNVRNLQCRIDSISELLRLDVKTIEDFTPELNLTPEEWEKGKKYINPSLPNLALGVTSTGSISRTYPPQYIHTLLTLLCKKFNVILLDQSRIDINYPTNFVNLTGKLKIREWLSVVANCDMVSSTDTGIYWVGLAFKKPGVVFFTTMQPELRISHHTDLILGVYPELPCKPCFDRQMVRDPEAWKACRKMLARNNCAPCTMLLTPTFTAKHIKDFARQRGLI